MTRIKQLAPYILVILAVALAVFASTVKDRAYWRGQMADVHHQLITAEIVKFSSNWYAENPFDLKFGLLGLPKSIETPTIQERQPYISYPPGAVLPIYVVAKIFNHEPTVYLVHDYNLLNHFLIGIVLAFMAFGIARGFKLSKVNATILAIIPLLLSYLLPGPMYFFQNVYFTDTAVILPALLLLMTEGWRYFKQVSSSNRWILTAQALLLFYGTLTDWYFVFLALGIFLLRIINGEYKTVWKFLQKSLAYWAPVVVALGLFFLQVISLNGNQELGGRFAARMSETCAQYPQTTMNNTYWQRYIPESFGYFSLGLLWLSFIISLAALIYMIYKRVKKQPLSMQFSAATSLLFLLVAVPFVRLYTLRCHSIFHDFTTMLFVGAIGLVPLIILPLLLIEQNIIKGSSFSLKITGKKIVIGALPTILLILAFTYAFSEHQRFKDHFPEIKPNYSLYGEFIRNNTAYESIVFSPDYEARALPSQQIIYTKKQIHHINKAVDIAKITASIEGNYTIKLFVKNSEADLEPSIASLVEQATAKKEIVVDGKKAALYDLPLSAVSKLPAS